MTAKRMQYLHEKPQLKWVENSKLFKCDASILPQANLTKWKKYKKLTKTKIK